MREQAIVNLVNLLKTSPMIKSVIRQFTPLDKISSQMYPCVLVEESNPETSIEWKTSGFADVVFAVDLICAVYSRDALATRLNELDVEVKKVIASDSTLGGTVIHATIMPDVERSGTAFTPYGFIRRPVQITYEGHISNGL